MRAGGSGLSAHGPSHEDATVLRVDDALGEAGGRDAARQLLASYPQIDALLVLVDVFAVGVMQHVHQIGLRAFMTSKLPPATTECERGLASPR